MMLHARYHDDLKWAPPSILRAQAVQVIYLKGTIASPQDRPPQP